MRNSTIRSVRNMFMDHPIRSTLGAVSILGIVIAMAAMTPELVRYVRMRRM